MRKYLKRLCYLVVILGISAAQAGSYDDFFIAIKRDNANAMQSLLTRGFDPNTLDPKGVPGLVLAVQEPSPKVADVLIRWPKTNVEMRTVKDESPLMLAALKGHVDLVKKLVARGADVNKTGWTPLHYAATTGQLEIINLLLENYAYIDAESPNGTTPLMMAAHYGTPEAVKLLLEAGADATLKNQLGMTAIDFANKANRREAAELIAASRRSQQPRGKW
ncbi:MAG: putative ankyrin repeat harboring protein [Ramlibacter sp.]|jgi:ankyrin repeat protein|nr:putative ankyrin repeat harboring protein [Ramlibacter sp.]